MKQDDDIDQLIKDHCKLCWLLRVPYIEALRGGMLHAE
jgi:hypothetical protein